MGTLLASNLDDQAALTISSEFLPTNRPGRCPHSVWMAALPDGTEIVVADVDGKPSSIGIEKAIAIVQSRAYLEGRARQLLVPLTREDGEWRVVAIDFGVEAQQHDCEFLMCFAFQSTKADIEVPGPYAEIGFTLPVQSRGARIFILTIEAVSGLAK